MSCRGICGRFKVKRATYGEALKLLELNGIPTDILPPTSSHIATPLPVMHALDATYYKCRTCCIYLRHADIRCPCCGSLLSTSIRDGRSSTFKHSLLKTTEAVRAAMRARKAA